MRDARDRRGTRGAGTTLVASSRPPSPTSIDRDVDAALAEREERGDGEALEEREIGRARSSTRVERALERVVVDRARRRAGSARRSGRDAARCRARCAARGARAMASTIAETLPLPFVPATCTAAKARCGMAERGEARARRGRGRAHPPRRARREAASSARGATRVTAARGVAAASGREPPVR